MTNRLAPLHVHHELIDELRTGRLAKALGFSPSRVSSWRHNGIPSRHQPAVARLARAQGLELPAGFLVPHDGHDEPAEARP